MTDVHIDESLYSRQIYALGLDAMKRMSNSSVLICGLGGLGVEIAKNVILAGVKSVTIQDTKLSKLSDISSQFYLTEKDIGTNRALASLSKLIQLNEYVSVYVSTNEITTDILRKYDCVVITEPRKETELIEISDFCHENGIKLVMTEVRGVFGSLFNDFGDDFYVKEPSGQKPTRFLLSHITNDKNGVVVIGEHEEHGLSNSDHVTFDQVEGMTEVNGKEFPVKVINQNSFSIGDTSKFHPYTSENGNGYGNQIILPVMMHFKKYRDCLKNPECISTDFYNIGREKQVLLAFTSLHRYLDRFSENVQENNFLNIVQEINNEFKIVDEIDLGIMKEFVREDAVICQTCSIFGGIAGQEVIKSVSSKFTPIQMFFQYNNIEALPEKIEYTPLNDRYDPYRLVFGNKQHEVMQNLNYFIVGAGAIGCEMLKNWAAMGIGTGKDGKIIITDMDSIERSNLNRQFLFRNTDIGKPKSVTAANAIKAMNSSVKIIPQQNKVGPESGKIYTNEFYKSLDGICNALDNQQTRLFNDSQCIYYQKPLLESGTLGPMGHFQIIVPHKTMSYGSFADPPTKGIPQCTLHSFPTNINHCTMWARDVFYGYFTQNPSNINQYISDRGYVKKMLSSDPGALIENLEAAEKYLHSEKPENYDDCVKIARLKFEELFNFYYRDLLYQNPTNKIEDGHPFWSGSRRIPTIQVYDPNNKYHAEFIRATAFMFSKLYDIEVGENAAQKAAQVEVPEWKPGSNIIDVEEKQTTKKKVSSNKIILSKVKKLCEAVSKYRKSKLLHVEQFEKDDNTNGHMDFVAAAANLRAISYRIPTSSILEIKGIAGNIIPALATTTSMICGFVSLEMMKVHCISEKNIEDFRDGFINISTSTFQFIQPSPAQIKQVGNTGIKFTLWDKWVVEGNLTLNEFIQKFIEKYKLIPTTILVGTTIVYCKELVGILLSEEKQEYFLNTHITDIYTKEAGMKLPDDKDCIQVNLMFDDIKETPPIYLKFK